MNYVSNFILLRSLFLMTCLHFSQSLAAQDISLSAGMNVSVMGAIEGAFVGPSIGLEVTTSIPVAVDFEMSIGSGKSGNLLILQPTVKYFFGKQKDNGFFLGTHGKIMSLAEQEDHQFLADHLYALGATLGIKQKLGNHLNFMMVTTPHVTLGGTNEGDVAGIGLMVGLSYTL